MDVLFQILAQIPTPEPAALGAWLVAAAAALGIVLLALTLWKTIRDLGAAPPEVPAEQQRVTRAELQAEVAKINAAEIPAERRYVTHSELQTEIAKISTSVHDLSDYTHASVHRLNDKLHEIGIKQATLGAEVQRAVEAMIKPLAEKLDTNTILTARIAERLEVGMKPKIE